MAGAADGAGGGAAVLIGALASGVNGPTWTAFRSIMLALCMVLGLQLAVALHFNSGELLLHVVFLTILAAILFVLLKWFISQTGLVTLEQQMKEMNSSGDDGNKVDTQKLE